MKPDAIIPLMFFLITLFFSLAVYGETEKNFSGKTESGISQDKFILNNGRVYKSEKFLQELPIEGNILGIYNNDDFLCYIKESGDGWLAGSIKNPDEVISEFNLGPGFRKLHKLICSGRIFYLLADIIQKSDPSDSESSGSLTVKAEKVLIRFDPDINEKKIIRGVDDFTLTDGGLITLTGSGLDCNGYLIPFTLEGERYIERIIDGRFVFLSNGSEIEIIDTISQRNIYIYREGKAFPFNPDYNIILEFNDNIESKETVSDTENMVYYQINVNGADTGRTETAPSNVGSSSLIKADAGRYCIIKAERWELDRIKGRYVRVNNINQPEEIKLYVPENRIIKIRFLYDGEKYIMNQSVYDN